MSGGQRSSFIFLLISSVYQVRRELYAQCFEELIRQTLLSSLERGLLLLRVRDEFR